MAATGGSVFRQTEGDCGSPDRRRAGLPPPGRGRADGGPARMRYNRQVSIPYDTLPLGLESPIQIFKIQEIALIHEADPLDARPRNID